MIASRGYFTHLLVTLPALILLTAAAAPLQAAQIDWHQRLDDGLRAAERSGKPLLVFVYISTEGEGHGGAYVPINVHRPNAPEASERIDLQRMLQRTLTDPAVAELAKYWEPVMLDLRLIQNDDARRRLHVSPGVDTSGGADGFQSRVAMYPITLFLEPDGTEIFRRHGYLPPEAYVVQLQCAIELFEKRNAVREQPQDAVRRRELGRAYMEMHPALNDEIYRLAVENLEEAIRLDPNNLTGANFDARVDLAILGLPQDSTGAIATLLSLQSEDRDRHRALEIEYYIAVAHYVNENLPAAMELLAKFETADDNSPYFDSEWTPQALGLLTYIRQMNDR
ncbi:MAG: hypothetical protein GX131_00680 [candidate division WS1 bacterium]|jgi:tetratricopeptide (TPR) repeat protein|nr:hypothetical protein [candidate division WS1 bacterium]